MQFFIYLKKNKIIIEFHSMYWRHLQISKITNIFCPLSYAIFKRMRDAEELMMNEINKDVRDNIM